MEFDFTRISSKGQIVLPKEMRKGLRQGEQLLILRDGGNIILKKADSLRKNLEEDLRFAKRTEESWKRYEEGKFTDATKAQFLDDLDKW